MASVAQDQRTDTPVSAARNNPLGSYDPLAEMDPRLAGIKRSGPWVAIQLGVPVFAAGCGLSCYYFLTLFSFNALISAILGLAFALLVRMAARSLLIEWLVARARQHAATKAPSEDADGQSAGSPTITGDRPHARR